MTSPLQFITLGMAIANRSDLSFLMPDDLELLAKSIGSGEGQVVWSEFKRLFGVTQSDNETLIEAVQMKIVEEKYLRKHAVIIRQTWLKPDEHQQLMKQNREWRDSARSRIKNDQTHNKRSPNSSGTDSKR